MADILKGAPVAALINEKTTAGVKALKDKGVTPVLAILQVGNSDADTAYKNSAIKRCTALEIGVKEVNLPSDVTQEKLLDEIDSLNKDNSVHGVLILRPMPKHIDDHAVRSALAPEKDVDGISDISLGGVFTGDNIGFAPCTAQACIEILDYYNIGLEGKRVCVVGHSLVVGRPVALMALCRDATVTVCHIKTADTPSHARQAEILIVAVGKAGLIDKNSMAPGQVIIDVGINVNAEGKLCGDVNSADADEIVAAYSPVPGGVGSVTTAVLMSHIVEAAKRAVGIE